jgi:pantoate--beta-alanine ligase
MVRDLNFPVRIEVMPIVREPDGLALSSRNVYLSPQERRSALVLYRSLKRVESDFRHGERRSDQLIAAATEEFAKEPAVRLDYFEIVDPDSLEPVRTVNRRTLAALAAFVGNTRLIDNIFLEPRA